jgi:hypothetical protein
MSNKKQILFIYTLAFIAGASIVAATEKSVGTALGIVSVITGIGAICGIYSAIKLWGKNLLVLLLAYSLATIPARAAGHNPPPAPQPKTGMQCNPFMGAAVLVIGGVIIYCFWRVCKKLDKLIPAPAPPQPPPPPPNTNTNSTPNFSAFLGPDGQVSFQLSASNTNCATCAAGHDISGSGYKGPDGLEYSDLVSFDLLSSSDLVNWQATATVTQWVSPTYVLSVLYDAARRPVASLTNSAGQAPNFSGCISTTNQFFALRLR